MKLQNLIVFAFLLQFGINPIHGQIRMSAMDWDSADSLQKSRIRIFSPGKSGRNKVWDFTKKLYYKDSHKVMFMKDSTGVISVAEPGRVRYYRTTPDSLVLIGGETPLEKREYVWEKHLVKFPLEFGDSIRKEFRCEGLYCGNHPFREEGTTLSKVDAEGSVVLAGNDTVRNVKRVHTIDTYSVCMDLNVAALDTAKLTHVIDECYEWYLPESEYPIIALCSSTTFH